MIDRQEGEEEDDRTDASKDNLSIHKQRKVIANTFLNDKNVYRNSENFENEEEK